MQSKLDHRSQVLSTTDMQIISVVIYSAHLQTSKQLFFCSLNMHGKNPHVHLNQTSDSLEPPASGFAYLPWYAIDFNNFFQQVNKTNIKSQRCYWIDYLTLNNVNVFQHTHRKKIKIVQLLTFNICQDSANNSVVHWNKPKISRTVNKGFK